MDVSGGNFSNGTNIQQYESNNTLAQKWKICKDGTGYRILSASKNQFCIDLSSGNINNGTNVQLYSSNATNAQIFNIQNINILSGANINGDYYINLSGCIVKSIDVTGGSSSNGANIQIYEGNGTKAQLWHIETDSNTHLSTITNKGSGKVLDACGGNFKNGTNIWQYQSNGSLAQKWKFVEQGNGYKIVSAMCDYACIDVCGGSYLNGANVQLWNNNGTAAQTFLLSTSNGVLPASTKNIQDSTYRINVACSTGKVIDVAGGATYNGANVQTYSWNGSNAQIFRIKKEGNYYRIINCANGKSIDVSGGTCIPGTNVQVWDSVDNCKNQLWAAYGFDNSDQIEFVNLATGMALDVAGAGKSSETNIDAYTRNNTQAQRFTITHENPKPTGTLIMYGPRTTVAQMANFYNYAYGGGRTYPADVYSSRGASNIVQFCQCCYSAAVTEGVDPAVLFCQAMHETGWLRFGGSVQPWQCNFGGLGATGGDVGGATFDNVYQGFLAQAQHLKCYACNLPASTNPPVDPRWENVILAYGRGCAPCVENLNGKWAVPGNGYGENIVRLMNELFKY